MFIHLVTWLHKTGQNSRTLGPWGAVNGAYFCFCNSLILYILNLFLLKKNLFHYNTGVFSGITCSKKLRNCRNECVSCNLCYATITPLPPSYRHSAHCCLRVRGKIKPAGSRSTTWPRENTKRSTKINQCLIALCVNFRVTSIILETSHHLQNRLCK